MTDTAAFSKHGGLRSDFTTTIVNSSDGASSEEDIMGLKDAHAHEHGYGMGPIGRGDDDILKTTDIRVSVDDAERGVTGRAVTTGDW